MDAATHLTNTYTDYPAAYKSLQLPANTGSRLRQQAEAWAKEIVLQALLELDYWPTPQALQTYLCWPDIDMLAEKTDCLGALSHWQPTAVSTLLTQLQETGWLQAVSTATEATAVLLPGDMALLCLKSAKTSSAPAGLGKAVEASAPLQQPAMNPQIAAPGLGSPLPRQATSAPVHAELYQQLKALRLHLAHQQQVRAFRICSNAVLQEMATHLPTDVKALEAIKGIGPRFLDHHSSHFLEVLTRYCLNYREQKDYGAQKEVG